MKMGEKQKQKALTMRRRGESYGAIGRATGVSKSTLSYWLKSVPLSPKHRARLYTARIRNLTLGSQSSKERRKREVDRILLSAREEIGAISQETHRLFGAGIYWAEGTKKGQLEITNSDPLLVLYMVRWFSDMFSMPAKSFKARLNIYAQQDDLRIRKFWSSLCGIPLSRFGKSYVKPLSKGYKKNNLYYGTIKVTVPKSTDMKYRVFGWIEGALKEEASRTRELRKRWGQLERVERVANLD